MLIIAGRSLMSSEWKKVLKDIQSSISGLDRFSFEFWKADKFIPFINQLSHYLEVFEEIMLIGHFDTAFSTLVETHLPKFPGCKMRVISHRFNAKDRDNPNRGGLEALARAGVVVKVNNHVHARMFLGYHSSHPISTLILGSFDFNRDGLSLYKRNAGIRTQNPDAIEEAHKFFNEIWQATATVTLDEYISSR
jgi:hypothetical protein